MPNFYLNRNRTDTLHKADLLEELEKAAQYFNYQEFGWRDFDKLSDRSVSASSIKRHFGSWRKGLDALRDHLENKNLTLNKRTHGAQRKYSDQELFQEMERIWLEVGQRPSRFEWETNNPNISYNTYKNRFNSWTEACLKFVEYKMGDEILIDAEDHIADKEKITTEVTKTKNIRKQNNRNVSVSLRLKVLERDNFSCVFCGKSPTTDFGTKLHIDHIIAFSKGGKSDFENLQTLCSECNLGKSDREIKR